MTAHQAYDKAFIALPRWVNWALALRNILMRPFGLTTSAGDGSRNMMLQLPIAHESDSNYQVGLVDRHLTFTIETDMSADQVAVTTRIWFNHCLGRLYLAAVLIPHKIIVKNAVRNLA